jgi:hypothetical protein
MAVEITEDLITAHLSDGRIISVPLAWSWRLSNATPEQRQHFEIIGTGQGVHWPDIDEDITDRCMQNLTFGSEAKARSAPLSGENLSWRCNAQ